MSGFYSFYGVKMRMYIAEKTKFFIAKIMYVVNKMERIIKRFSRQEIFWQQLLCNTYFYVNKFKSIF